MTSLVRQPRRHWERVLATHPVIKLAGTLVREAIEPCALHPATAADALLLSASSLHPNHLTTLRLYLHIIKNALWSRLGSFNFFLCQVWMSRMKLWTYDTREGTPFFMVAGEMSPGPKCNGPTSLYIPSTGGQTGYVGLCVWTIFSWWEAGIATKPQINQSKLFSNIFSPIY